MIELTDNNFVEFIKNNSVVVVDFWAPWCGPCKFFAPTFEEVSRELTTEQLKFVKVDVDVSPDAAQENKIRSIPTIVIFKNGKEVKRVSGMLDKKSFLRLISEFK
jgi:thioredoxin